MSETTSSATQTAVNARQPADLAAWVRAGALRPLDLALADFIRIKGPEPNPDVILAIALTSARNGQGHACLDLTATLQQPENLLERRRDDADADPLIARQLVEALAAIGGPANWIRSLAASPAVSDRLNAGADDGASPLILAGSPDRPLLYLRRYWHDEQRISELIAARLHQPVDVDTEALSQLLDRLFGPSDQTASKPEWQRIACALAARRRFFIITGGPGTGKTTTVVRLLAVLQGLIDRRRTPLRIELAAPTGKAAARLNESIAAQLRDLSGLFESAEALPGSVKTLHRLLGVIPGSRHFRHHAANPLPADLVVVDEASMVDVELMARLLDALRPDARLILLGDKDQLSSVEAGAVLGDLCQNAADGHYTPETADWLKQASGAILPPDLLDTNGSPRDQAIVMLRESYRFQPQGGIGALAALINQTHPAAVSSQQRLAAIQQLFAANQTSDPKLGIIKAIPLASPRAPELAELVIAGYASGFGDGPGYLGLMQSKAPEPGSDQTAIDAWARQILDAQKRFQLLSALRSGPWGVEGLNTFVLAELRRAGWLSASRIEGGQWFAGRPVLMTSNDYRLDLMNGDIGVTLELGTQASPGADQAASRLRVAFPANDGGVRWVLPSRLQSVQTVFAMTVHKSQGSEFTHTALILPDRSNPVLTRELLYTAITRAKQQMTLLYPDEAVLADAMTRRVERVSGLRIPNPP